MPFETHPLKLEDLNESFLVGEKAFHAHNRLVYTGILSDASRAVLVKSREPDFPEPENVKNFKVLNEKGEIVAGSRWSIQKQDEEVTISVEDAVNKRIKSEITEMRHELARSLYTIFAQGKRDILGVYADSEAPSTSDSAVGNKKILKFPPRIELDVLYVHPDYQRKGIASDLLKWGFEKSEQLGLPIYLEATAEGRPVYERYGFETVRVERFDARPFGVDEEVEYAVGFIPILAYLPIFVVDRRLTGRVVYDSARAEEGWRW
jgi:GNAT superfamily N-acetyltransferase